ncbi:MAG: Uma2 family endonuclease [Bacteroidetes bacterium]|nr:MAG: Uma2 family endonuclease [Bacteroidota bacterium]
MSAAHKLHFTIEDYLETESLSPVKREYYRGEIFDMAGASPVHNLIVGNLASILGQYLKGKPCNFFPSDLKVFVEKYLFFTYPDLTIVCGQPEFFEKDENTLMNPSVIIEVTSKSNSNYDKSGKFGLFRALPSFEEYILISSFTHEVIIYHKHDENVWGITASENQLSENVFIKTIDLTISLEDIYYNTALIENKLTLKSFNQIL